MDNPTTGPMVESNRPRSLHDFTRFNKIMEGLEEWRCADHADNTSLSRSQVIEIVEGVRAFRKAP